MTDITVSAQVNPRDVLDEMDTDDIVEYLKEHGIGIDTTTHCPDLVHDFFHGDLDLKTLLNDIGKDAVVPVLREFIKEKDIQI
jgi:hypothetical protein